MTDRRTLFTHAGLAALAAGTAMGAAGCAKPVQVGSGAAEATVPSKDVPVGGGTVLRDARFVVTQPTAGVFKAFDRACTHSACPVSSVEGGAIVCKCHGSRFSLTDGSVITGPAKRPLEARSVTLEGDTLRLSQ